MSRIVLIGPPGCGKSTVGFALAERLQRPFFDTDNLIEIKSGKKITDIFVEDGEEVFREHRVRGATKCAATGISSD
jgi:shikimate kinase